MRKSYELFTRYRYWYLWNENHPHRPEGECDRSGFTGDRYSYSPSSMGRTVAGRVAECCQGLRQKHRGKVRREGGTGVAVITYPDGIQWGGEVVRLVIGIASKGEEHLEFLKRIVEMVKSAEDTDALVANATEEELYRQLNGLT